MVHRKDDVVHAFTLIRSPWLTGHYRSGILSVLVFDADISCRSGMTVAGFVGEGNRILIVMIEVEWWPVVCGEGICDN